MCGANAHERLFDHTSFCAMPVVRSCHAGQWAALIDAAPRCKEVGHGTPQVYGRGSVRDGVFLARRATLIVRCIVRQAGDVEEVDGRGEAGASHKRRFVRRLKDLNMTGKRKSYDRQVYTTFPCPALSAVYGSGAGPRSRSLKRPVKLPISRNTGKITRVTKLGISSIANSLRYLWSR
jgi:hypothetical protein